MTDCPPLPLLALAVRRLPRQDARTVRLAAYRLTFSLGLDAVELARRADAGEPAVDEVELALAEVWFDDVAHRAITSQGPLCDLRERLASGSAVDLVLPPSTAA